ncbi:MAG: EF-P beta-lysylation protein EpmB [Gammaproteobacteria bacterium]|nr:EF-P beta-lysylation protein EpmB [Gammaproteobacteria bacterium]
MRRPAELLAELGLDPSLPQLDFERLQAFPLRVPRSFVARMRRGDPRDPLFLQVWPAAREADRHGGFGRDPVGEWPQRAAGGVIRKYRGRALVVTTGACAVHCRYCFRRHYPYGDPFGARGGWRATLTELAADASLEEVILSGGDPLSLDDDKLAALIHGLNAIPHLRRLRLHTRTAVVEPQRVGDRLLAVLAQSRLTRVVVLHTNHANELDRSVAAACAGLRQVSCLLLNQSVLLADVNDSVEALAALSQALCDLGVLPYYLHVMDKVAGAAHFEVDSTRAAWLMRGLAACCPGYLVPRLVRERAGAAAKEWIGW